MWGLGGLTFGLTMRYLGMSLGMAVALGYCAAFGTLMPPIFHGEFVEQGAAARTSGHGDPGSASASAWLGIAIAGLAGMSKEREMSEEQKKAAIKEFNFKKGILVATFSGVMSAVVRLRPGRRRADQGDHRSRHGTHRRAARGAARAAGAGRRAAWAASRRTSSGACC